MRAWIRTDVGDPPDPAVAEPRKALDGAVGANAPTGWDQRAGARAPSKETHPPVRSNPPATGSLEVRQRREPDREGVVHRVRQDP